MLIQKLVVQMFGYSVDQYCSKVVIGWYRLVSAGARVCCVWRMWDASLNWLQGKEEPGLQWCDLSLGGWRQGREYLGLQWCDLSLGGWRRGREYLGLQWCDLSLGGWQQGREEPGLQWCDLFLGGWLQGRLEPNTYRSLLVWGQLRNEIIPTIPWNHTHNTMKSYQRHTMKSYQWYEFIPFTMKTDQQFTIRKYKAGEISHT